MINYINDNNDKIAKFDFDYYFLRKNYQMASAIKALSVTNDIQEAYFKKEENLDKKDLNAFCFFGFFFCFHLN